MQDKSRSLLLGVLLSTLFGCNLAIDAQFTRPDPKPDADGPLAPGDDPTGIPGTPEFDGSVAGDGDGLPLLDGSTPDPIEADGSVAMPCSQDTECDASEFCSVSGACAPRCDEVSGCVGPSVPEDIQLLGDGTWVYWGTPGGVDSAGNPLADGAILRWNGDTTPEIVTGGLKAPFLKALVDGYLYFSDGYDSPAQLVLAVPGSAKQAFRGAVVDAVWNSDTYLWWTQFNQENFMELWRTPRVGAPADTMVVARTVRWRAGGFASSDSHVFDVRDTAGSRQGLYAKQLGTPSERKLAESGDPSFNALLPGEHDVIAELYVCELKRYPVDGSAPKNLVDVRLLGYGQSCDATAAVWTGQRRGNWLTWFVRLHPLAGSPGELMVGRSHTDMQVPVQLFAQISITTHPSFREAGGVQLNAKGDGITYYHPTEKRLFTRTIPGFPCSDTLACPDDLVCTLDGVCH